MDGGGRFDWGWGSSSHFNSLNRGSLSIQLSEKANFFYC